MKSLNCFHNMITMVCHNIYTVPLYEYSNVRIQLYFLSSESFPVVLLATRPGAPIYNPVSIPPVLK